MTAAPASAVAAAAVAAASVVAVLHLAVGHNAARSGVHEVQGAADRAQGVQQPART